MENSISREPASPDEIQRFIDSVAQCTRNTQGAADAQDGASEDVTQNSAEYLLHDKDVLVQDTKIGQDYHAISIRVLEDAESDSAKVTTYFYNVTDALFTVDQKILSPTTQRVPEQRSADSGLDSTPEALSAIPTIFGLGYYNELMMLLRRCTPDMRVQ